MVTMGVQEHIRQAQHFLEASEQEFDAGDVLQGSEKLWGAAYQLVIAAAQQRGWPYGNHRDLKNAAQRIAVAYNNPLIRSDFAVAEKFHINFYHGFMDDFEVESDRTVVREFVGLMLGILAE